MSDSNKDNKMEQELKENVESPEREAAGDVPSQSAPSRSVPQAASPSASGVNHETPEEFDSPEVENICSAVNFLAIDDLCELCHDNKVDCKIIPCGHKSFCKRCIDNLISDGVKLCPECKETIREYEIIPHVNQSLTPLVTPTEVRTIANSSQQGIKGYSKYQRFLRGPIEKMKVFDLPGIGDVYGGRLQEAGYTMAQDLVDKYTNSKNEAEFKETLFAIIKRNDEYNIGRCITAIKDHIDMISKRKQSG